MISGPKGPLFEEEKVKTLNVVELRSGYDRQQDPLAWD